MKWVVISTVGKNPGDEFIRVGIGHAIKAVDSKATGSIIDKESNSIFRPEPFVCQSSGVWTAIIVGRA